MGALKSNSIFNPVNQLNKLGNAYNSAGVVGQIVNPMAYAFGDKGHVPGAGVMDAGGAVNSGLDPLDMFGGQRAAKAAMPANFNPQAPGSIFAPRQYGGPAPNMPLPGTPTNGLAGGAQSGGIDWAPIIARALRKS